MKIIKSAEIQVKITELKKKNSNSFSSNYFLNPLNDEIQILENENAILFLTKDKDIYRTYFAYNDLNSFENLLLKLPKDIKISLEILSKKEVEKELFDCLNKYLLFETAYERYRCKCTNLRIFQKININNIQTAKEEDLEQIDLLLNETFNHHTSHLPTKEELMKLINNQNIIISKTDDKITSLIVYKKVGNNINFDQLINKDNQPLKMMYILDCLYSILKEQEYNEVFLWVDTLYNKDVVKLHKLYGYKSDLLKDYYFINNKLQKAKK